MMHAVEAENNTDERLLSETPAKPVPDLDDGQSKQHSGSLRLDYTSHLSASFISQRSSSIESCESPFLTSPRRSLSDKETDRQNGRQALESESDNPTFVNSDLMLNRDQEDIECRPNSQTLNNGTSLETTLLHPDHQSTPNRDGSYFRPNVPLSEDQHFSLSMDGLAEEERQVRDGEMGEGRLIFKPGDLVTPIMGFETMEARSKFTVFKIHVQKNISVDDSPESWFVFRRYSDFVHLNERLKYQFPHFRLSLPPKRWFRDNFDRNFLEDRLLGLQAFLDNIIGHKDLCNSDAVRAFFCIDEPPGPHDSLEESRALCESLEESMYTLRQQLKEKESEITLLKEELDLYKSQVCLLTDQLKVINNRPHNNDVTSPSSSGTGHSLAECDRLTPMSPVSAAEEKELSDS